MAGPGGGPPRKSHTKSKKGCKTCKKRHIRCDENWPQCRNCTKHNVRCDYQDQLPAGEDLASGTFGAAQSPSPEMEVEQWIKTGVFPFDELNVQNPSQFTGLTKNDFRLIHHLCNAYRQLYKKGAVYCAPWISQLPTFLDIAGRGHRCVLSALLALSAQRMAIGSNTQEMNNLADIYREHALRTTQEALANFSQDNSDSILATSIILSWQVEDLASWSSLMQGVNTVISHMGDWRYESSIASFAESYILARPTPVIGSEHSLGHSVAAMQQLADLVPNESPLKLSLQRCWQAGLDISNASRTMTAPQIFGKLAYLRNRVLWAPFDFFLTMGMNDLPLLAIAHCFSMACAVDASLPELNGACLGGLVPSTIDQIDSRLRFAPQGTFQPPEQIEILMQFPRHMMQRFPQHTAPADTMFSFNQQHQNQPTASSPFSFEGVDVHSNPGTPPYPPTLHYLESPSMSELSMPASPYMLDYAAASASSHRHSAQFSVPRPSSIYSDQGSLTLVSTHDSPRFSPSYSPQPDTPGFFHYTPEPVPDNAAAGSSAGSAFASGLVNSEIWV